MSERRISLGNFDHHDGEGGGDFSDVRDPAGPIDRT